MRTKKTLARLLSLVLVMVMVLSVLPVGAAAAETSGWKQVMGDWYYYENGSPVKGWKYIGSNWYYFIPAHGGIMCIGWLNTDPTYFNGGDPPFTGNWYHFSSSGAMDSGKWIKSTVHDEDNNTYTIWYYATSSGRLAEGWEWIGNAWYYFKDNVMQTGWINSDPTYFTEGGTNGKWYYLESSGRMATGWKYFTETNDDGSSYSYWAYFLPNGAQVTGAWKKINDTWYYFDDYGAMYSDGLYQFGDNEYYYFLPSGAMATGWKVLSYTTESGATESYWAYFKSSGLMALNGWEWDGSNWYYFENGGYYAGGLYNISGKYYYFNDSGSMYKGWKYLDGKWSYFQSSGAMKVLGTLKIDGADYAFIDGVMVTNRWFDQRYYGSSGVMLKNTSKTINGTYYTFDAKGVPSPYYFNPNDQYGTYGYLLF